MSAEQPIRMPRPASITRAAPWIVGVAGALVGLVAEHIGQSWLGEAWIPILDLGIGWLMIACGLVASQARPGQPAGRRLVVAGFLWFVGTLMGSDSEPMFSIGFAFGGYHNLVLAWLALSFPGRQPTGRIARTSLLIAVGLFALQTIARLIRTAPDTIGLTLLDQATAESIVEWIDVLRAASVVAIGVLIAARFVGTPPVERRYLAPVLAAGAATAIASGSNARFALTSLGFIPNIGEEAAITLGWAFNVVRILVPLAILLGVVRLRGARAAMAGAVARVGETPSTGTLQDALATALGDPRLRVLTWEPALDAYVDHTGTPASSADLVALEAEQGLAVMPVNSGEERLAIIVLARSMGEDPTLVEAGVALTRLVIRNERQSVRIQDQLADVRASRARIVEAADVERRRIERDLHDGLQQRMVALAMQLRTADETQDQRDALRRGSAEVLAILDDVREMARGIHPAVLSEAGLAAAIRAAADRPPVPADVDLRLSGRNSGAAEATAYYVVSEALANVAKHALGATAVSVEASDDDRRLRVVVEDDGPGGADPEGHGLAGLADRVAALDGQFRVDVGTRGGTRIVAEVPIA